MKQFNLYNIKCAGCVSKIESKLSSLNGIKDAKVNLLEKTLYIKYTAQNMDAEVIKAVESLGYGITQDNVAEDHISLRISVGLPIIIGLFMMTFGMTDILMPNYATIAGFRWGILESFITLVIILFSGKTIFINGIRGFYTLNFNMHSLIILGISSAWLYSTWVVISNYFFTNLDANHVYFESALIIIGLINLGAHLENRAKSSTTDAILALSKLQPSETTIIKDGQEQIINTNLLAIGDMVKVKPGERIPADGQITNGNGYLDESMLTGEPLPIHKKINGNVIAGSVNTNGTFIFSVTGVGGETLLSEIINLVRSAQMSKPALAKLADNVAKIFVPTIIIFAILTALIWLVIGPEPRVFYGVSTFMTILIIACPCSVGLAIPVALMVGLGKSASKGVLIRNASCLTSLSNLSYVLLDKTGTITEGKPTVIGMETKEADTEQECLHLLKALENNSEHPIASAILNYLPDLQPNILVEEFIMVSGSGVRAKINGKTYLAGSKEWMLEENHLQSNLFIDNHCTQVFLSDTKNILARIDINDKVKPDSAKAIHDLYQMGLNVAMVTGDNKENANYIASLVGLDTIYASCKPADKINIVKQLQQTYTVAFVGDGINDAPSLIQADVGIAIGGGTDVAMQSADITLMRGSLTLLKDTILIGHAINRNMRQNLFGSFIYNTVAVFIAAGLLYPIWHILLNPIIASLAMSLSSITVILNALRLRKL